MRRKYRLSFTLLLVVRNVKTPLPLCSRRFFCVSFSIHFAASPGPGVTAQVMRCARQFLTLTDLSLPYSGRALPHDDDFSSSGLVSLGREDGRTSMSYMKCLSQQELSLNSWGFFARNS